MPNTCLLCSNNAVAESLGENPTIKCERCGRYSITLEFYQDVVKDLSEVQRAALSASTRQAAEIGNPLLLKTSNWTRLVESHQSTMSRKVDMVLRGVAKRAPYLGASHQFSTVVDYPLFDLRNDVEFNSLIFELQQEGLIRPATITGERSIVNLALTMKGWRFIEPSQQPGGEAGLCFVAMWFDPSLNEAYELGIVAAVELDCRMKAHRVDRKEHNNQITDEIMAGIRSAEFTVADFTGQRAGVYYEAGFAHGLGRPVIYTCREDHIKDRHFDTSVINHVVWADPADLRLKLARRIKATILPKA